MAVEEYPDDVKWSWTKFFIGKVSNKFVAWVVSTVLVFKSVFSDGIVVSERNEMIILVVWGVVTLIFMLAGALDIAVKNMKISAELKAGASLVKEMKDER